MSESAALFLQLVLALKALQPEPTQFGLDLTLPVAFLIVFSFLRCTKACFNCRRFGKLDGLTFTDLFEWAALDVCLE